MQQSSNHKAGTHRKSLPTELLITISVSLVLILAALVLVSYNNGWLSSIGAQQTVEEVSDVSVSQTVVEDASVVEVSAVPAPAMTPSPAPVVVQNPSQYDIQMKPPTSDESQSVSLLSASFMFSSLNPPDFESDYSQLIDDGSLDALSFAVGVFTLTNDTVYTDDTRIPAYAVPDITTEHISTLHRNSEYRRIAVSDNGWSMVEFRNSDTIGYVENTRIHTIKPIGDIATIEPVATTTPSPNATPQLKHTYNSDGLYLYGEVRGIKVYVDEEVSPGFIKKYIEDIEELPAMLANAESINSINITTEDFKGKFPSLSHIETRILGVTSPSSRTIWINGNLYSRGTILHESIHVWDVITNHGLSSSTEFKDIYAAEKSAVSVTPGNNVNAMEFLASAAELYYDSPWHLKTAAPLTYAFLRANL